METTTKAKAITVHGRRWTDGAGNTYHTATVYADGVEVANVPLTYGYESQYEESAAKALELAGLMPGREHYKNGGNEAPFRYWQRQGVNYRTMATDVQRRKDL